MTSHYLEPSFLYIKIKKASDGEFNSGKFYQNDFIYAPFYVNTWNNPYWIWNTNQFYCSWNSRCGWYGNWNTWNHHNSVKPNRNQSVRPTAPSRRN